MTVLAGPELYHVGFVVDDVHEAAARYHDALGLDFATVARRSVQVGVHGEVRQVELLVTYSTGDPPHVELMQELSGGTWGRHAFNLNHVGFWVPDVPGAAGRLTRNGFVAEVASVDPDGRPQRFSYHRTPSGLWLELVCDTVRPDLRRWLAGGSYP